MAETQDLTTKQARRWLKERAKTRMYIDVLPSEPLPPWTYLVHNHVLPQKPIGKNGFRAWLTNQSEGLVKCRCDFGGCKNAKVHKVHYRVDRGASDLKKPTAV
jgi:hypothetical protein